MNPYPRRNSVLIMDNASTHHFDGLWEMVEARYASITFFKHSNLIGPTADADFYICQHTLPISTPSKKASRLWRPGSVATEIMCWGNLWEMKAVSHLQCCGKLCLWQWHRMPLLGGIVIVVILFDVIRWYLLWVPMNIICTIYIIWCEVTRRTIILQVSMPFILVTRDILQTASFSFSQTLACFFCFFISLACFRTVLSTDRVNSPTAPSAILIVLTK